MHVLELLALAVLLAPQEPLGRDRSAQPAPEPAFASACDVVFPDERTIVVADWDGNAHVSLDGGATWEVHAMRTWTRELTVDPRKTIWSLYYWHGIHEPSQAALVHSKNRGRVWTSVRWPDERAVPVDFMTRPGDEPVLLDGKGQVWRHEAWGTETIASWKPLGEPAPDRSGLCGLARGDLLYVATEGEVWMSADGGTKWFATAGPHRVVAIEPMPRATPGEPERAAVATAAGMLHTIEIATREWTEVGSFPAPHAIDGLATTADAIWVAGLTTGVHPLAGWIDHAGRWRSMQGLPGRSSCNAIRTAPDGRVWVANHALYAAAPGAERWERVWPE